MTVNMILCETTIDCYIVDLSANRDGYRVTLTDTENVYKSVYFDKTFTDKKKAIGKYKKIVSDLLNEMI